MDRLFRAVSHADMRMHETIFRNWNIQVEDLSQIVGQFLDRWYQEKPANAGEA